MDRNHGNKPNPSGAQHKSNAAPIAYDEEIPGKPPGKFRRMISKHRRAIREEAAKLPPENDDHPPTYDQLKLVPHAETERKISHHHHGDDNHHHHGKTCFGRLRGVWRLAVDHLGLRHWAFVAVMIAYAFLGGAIFGWLERRHLDEIREEQRQQLTNDRGELMNKIFKLSNATWSLGLVGQLDDLIKEYQREKGLFPKEIPHWDLWDGVFYSYTVFTTIGYGHFVPVSRSGRIATILYALFGIPLLLAVLADFGKLLTRVLKRVYNWVRRMVVYLWRMRKWRKMKARGEDAHIGGEEPQVDDTQFDFPLPLALFMVVGWLFMCAAFFQLWETNWSYFDAFYFFFISLSTIGLGDLVPDHPKYMIAGFPFILIGLTLVSLVINLIQNRIAELKEKAGVMLEEQLGLDPGLDTVSASECDSEIGQGGLADLFDPSQLPINTDPGTQAEEKEKKDEDKARFALGVMQTMTLKAKRRRIGTQTEDSYLRDVVGGHLGFERPSVISSPLHWSPGNRSSRSDMISMASEGLYYDARGSLEQF